MKKIGLAALTAVLMTSGSAYAADVFNSGGLKDEPGVLDAPQKVNWTGFYIGGSLGYGNANHNLTVQDYFKDFCAIKAQAEDPDFNPFDDDVDTAAAAAVGIPAPGGIPAHSATLANLKKIPGVTGTSCETATHQLLKAPNLNPVTTVAGESRDVANLDGINSSGLVGDGRVGFDVQRGRLVFGVFGSYGFNDMSTEASIGISPKAIEASIEKGEEWSLGARAGFLVNPRTLAYVLAAYAETEYEFGVSGFGKSESKDVSFSGITVGGGVEFAVTQNVFLGIEGTHTFYGEEVIADEYSALKNEGSRLVDELDETKVMGTLKIKLNSGLPSFTD